MERRYELRKETLLEEFRVNLAVLHGSLKRLKRFVELFASCLARCEQEQHALDFVSSLISDVDRKNTESIVYRYDQDRKDLQYFKIYDFDGKNLRHKLTVDFIAQQLGYPHQMRFGAYSLYGMQRPDPARFALNQ